MKLIITKNYEQMSQTAAISVLGAVSGAYEKRVNISVTAGSTPKGMYEYLEKILKDAVVPHVHYYNFDEIAVKGKEGVTMAALKKLFFDPCNISEDQIERFDTSNYQGYDEKIQKDGGLDLVVMGLGEDGHFCGNLPGTLESFDEGCRAVSNHLFPRLEDRIAFLVGGKEYMTDYYVTFGPRTIMNAKKLILIVNGEKKAEALKNIVEGELDLSRPSTVLRLHPDLTIICDQAAVTLLSDKKYLH